jgi:hypothetical protein
MAYREEWSYVVPNLLNGQFSCCLSDLLSVQRRPRHPIQDDDAELWISRPWTSVCLGFGFCWLPPPFPGGVPQLGRTKPTKKTIDDITELADGENRRCIRGIAGLKAAATTALKRYANIFLWLARRHNIIVVPFTFTLGCFIPIWNIVVRGFLGYAHPRLVVFFRYEI